jgi:YgiT-type zinc finger domain-containing protein
MVDRAMPPRHLNRYTTSCTVCGGSVVEKHVTVIYPDKQGGQRAIHGVPAGVCEQCGERYLHAAVAIEIERILGEPPERLEEIGASDFAAAV